MLRRIGAALAATVVMTAVAAACTPDPATPGGPTTTTTAVPVTGDDLVRLNQVQLLGSHNSYHVAPEGTILIPLTLGGAVAPALVQALGNPLALNYTHAPLPTQLARGIRTFELDVYADPEGGRFSWPRLAQLLNVQYPAVPPGMDQPGFKVLHIADVDFTSTCASLQVCLGQIRTWSDAHPGHLPIVINLEMKGDGLSLPDSLGFTPILPFDAPTLDALDAELRTALGDRLITPDDVRGSAATLNQAITTTGWPTLRDSRGKVLIFMDNADVRSTYLAGHPSLQGRAMFTSSGEGQADGAVLKVNDPGDGSRIRSLVQQGYLVRTRADDDPASAPSAARKAVSLDSGAQVVHSDWPVGEPYPFSGYELTFGTPAAARCNPVNTTAATCTAAAVGEP